MVAMIDASPTHRIAIITASPSCVPATFKRPARAPWRKLLAMMSVTVGPGTMTIAKHAAT